MEDVRDPYWKRNPDVVAEESAAALYGEDFDDDEQYPPDGWWKYDSGE